MSYCAGPESATCGLPTRVAGDRRAPTPPPRQRPRAPGPGPSPARRRPLACCASRPSPRPTAPSRSPASRPDPARPRPATPRRRSSSRPATPPAGQVLASVRMRAQELDDGGGTMLSGEIPAGGAAMVVVRREGGDRAVRRMRSANRAAGAAAGPARRRRSAHVAVRWRATDADGDRLVATVEYRANRGRSWRTVYIGGSTGSVRLAGRELAPSRRARIRVRVDDGFDERVGTSSAFTVLAAPPQARILEPLRGARLREGAPLILRAEASSAGRPLAGRALRWFDGRRALGTGRTLTAAPPRRRSTHDPARRHRGRPAHDPHRRHLGGRRPAGVPRALRARPPEPARPRARLRVASTAAATLTPRGRRFPVGPARAHPDHPDPPGSRPLRLALRLPVAPAAGPGRRSRSPAGDAGQTSSLRRRCPLT